jgi:lactoylglutathione lyase
MLGVVTMNRALFQKIDCHSLPVPDLESAIAFYESLGHELIWQDNSGAGLRIPGCEAELVLHTDDRPAETDFAVESVPEAVAAFVEAGGRVVHGPFEIRIGLCAVLADPWDNPIVILDNSKGLLKVDEQKRVIGSGETE